MTLKILSNGIRRKIIFAYFLVIVLNSISFYKETEFIGYFLPILLMVLPIIIIKKIKISFSIIDFLIGFSISLIILLPYALFEIFNGRVFILPSIETLIFHLTVVAIPEELFFRGLIQEGFGNNKFSILITSLMFSIAHLPVFIFENNSYAPLTFFPSLVIGYIYWKRKNILPCVIFHFTANVIWISFRHNSTF